MAKRASISKATETEVLRRSRRRCCLCVALLGDIAVKQGQIAHLDRDASNNDPSNLAFLCLEHHDQYDSRTSQSKGFKETELRSYRDKLHSTLPAIISTEKQTSAGFLPAKPSTENADAAPDDQERQIYTELWNCLLDFRIAAHNLVDWLQDRVHQDPYGKFIDALNAYQAVVRRNEPFIVPLILVPARAIVSQGRKIATKCQTLQRLQKQREMCRDLVADEQIAEKMIEVDGEQQKAVEELDRLCEEVKNAIHTRTLRKPSLGSS